MVSEEQMELRAKLNLSHINEHNGNWRGHTLMTHKQFGFSRNELDTVETVDNKIIQQKPRLQPLDTFVLST